MARAAAEAQKLAPRARAAQSLLRVRTLGVLEVDHVLALEQVHLLDARDGVDAQPLQRALQPLVVRRRRLVHCLLLSARAHRRVVRLGYHTSAGRAARRLLQHSAAAERVRLRLLYQAQPVSRLALCSADGPAAGPVTRAEASWHKAWPMRSSCPAMTHSAVPQHAPASQPEHSPAAPTGYGPAAPAH